MGQIIGKHSWRSSAIGLWAALIVPLNDATHWQLEKYSNIPANVVSFNRDGMNVRVDKSASPLIHALNSSRKVVGFHIKGEFRGLPSFPDVARQGEKGADDYALRIGFVIPGNKRLSGFKKLLAPQWVKSLYEKVPEGSGVDHIEFFNVTQSPQQLGLRRIHPLSDLIEENFFAQVSRAGTFDYEYTLKTPLEAVAIWISIDGDDTKSAFDVLISTLELAIQ